MAAGWAVVTFGLGALLILTLLVSQRRSGPRAWPTWTLVLSSQSPDRRRYEDYEADLADELAALGAALRLARRQSENGELQEAERTLDAASRYVTRHVPTLRERLTTWRDAARVLSAMYPLPRMRVLLFKGWTLRGVATVEALARPVLDAARRFSLRVYVLLYGLKLVLRGFTGDEETRLDASGTLRRRLESFEALRGDLGTLHGASLEVYKALLISLQAHTPNQHGSERPS